MALSFAVFVVASAALLVLNGPFAARVRARHPELLPRLRLDDQPMSVQYARWQFSLLPYSGFILRRQFVEQFTGEPDLRKLSESIFWVHVVQVAGFASFFLGIIIGGVGAIAA